MQNNDYAEREAWIRNVFDLLWLNRVIEVSDVLWLFGTHHHEPKTLYRWAMKRLFGMLVEINSEMTAAAKIAASCQTNGPVVVSLQLLSQSRDTFVVPWLIAFVSRGGASAGWFLKTVEEIWRTAEFTDVLTQTTQYYRHDHPTVRQLACQTAVQRILDGHGQDTTVIPQIIPEYGPAEPCFLAAAEKIWASVERREAFRSARLYFCHPNKAVRELARHTIASRMLPAWTSRLWPTTRLILGLFAARIRTKQAAAEAHQTAPIRGLPEAETA